MNLFQMDVKSVILNEEVYVEQPKGFEDLKLLNHKYRLKKALYGLKQAPIAWYKRLTTYLMEKRFKKKRVDKIIFIQWIKTRLLVAQIYIDDIVFGVTLSDFALNFVKERNLK